MTINKKYGIVLGFLGILATMHAQYWYHRNISLGDSAIMSVYLAFIIFTIGSYFEYRKMKKFSEQDRIQTTPSGDDSISRAKIVESIKSETVSLEDALEFYENLVKDIKEMYGTTDIEKLKKLAEENDDLWLEEHIHDLEMYHAIKKKVGDKK